MGLEAVTLEGQSVRLEPLTMDHVEGLWEAGSDAEIWRFTTSAIRSKDEMRMYVATALVEKAYGVTLPFATCDRETGRVIGTTRYANIAPEHRRLEIGWTFVNPQWQRTPVNTEAKYLMFRHAFEKLGFNRVELKTNALNTKSRNAMLRIGCTEEGTLRRHMANPDGTFRDTVYFSVIAEEWPAVKTRLEEMLTRPWQKSAAQL